MSRTRMDWLIMQYCYGLYEGQLQFKVPQNKEFLGTRISTQMQHYGFSYLVP